MPDAPSPMDAAKRAVKAARECLQRARKSCAGRHEGCQTSRRRSKRSFRLFRYDLVHRRKKRVEPNIDEIHRLLNDVVNASLTVRQAAHSHGRPCVTPSPETTG